MREAHLSHEEKINGICNSLKSYAASGARVRLAKAEVSHFVPNPHDMSGSRPKLDLSQLTEIISIDINSKTCTAESGVSFDKLTRATLKHGLIPYTVPELKGITVGGAVSGCSIESMSYRYGGFHDSCLEYEVISGTGDAITCSLEKNPELFNMVHGSYGTLGVITKAKFKLLPAKPFVRMEYFKFETIEEFWNFMLARIAMADYDFIDAIIHDRKTFVACLGKMVDKAPHQSRYDWLKIFYKSTATKTVDYLSTYDYFFRYDTECHWLTKTVPLMERWPARLLLGKMVLGSTNLIKWSKRVAPLMRMKKRPEVVVDVFIPSERFTDFFKWYEKDFDFFPLWLVPYKPPAPYPWIDDKHAANMKSGLFIDCAIYGKRNDRADIDYSELLEKKTYELGGIKTLISRNHYDRDTFWSIYNKERYDSVKATIDPNGMFNNLYDKFHPGK